MPHAVAILITTDEFLQSTGAGSVLMPERVHEAALALLRLLRAALPESALTVSYPKQTTDTVARIGVDRLRSEEQGAAAAVVEQFLRDYPGWTFDTLAGQSPIFGERPAAADGG
jgi:hypothetical protein